ncbi:MAG: hypothetical protein JXA42_16660 [Anaerolineales bacterium]|nr:hypothetical protein [Anaerolineales bacterium]
MSEELKTWINIAALVMVIAFVSGGLLLAIAVRQLKKIKIPPNAGFVATLQGIPLILVLGLDLLDLALDFLAAPVAWVILEYMGLKGLQAVTVVEGLVPGTQLIPTLTVCWIISRLMPDRLAQLVELREGAGAIRAGKKP